jgi:hypothetical protein
VLDIFVLVHFGLVVSLVEIGRIVVLIGDSDTNEFRHYSKKAGQSKLMRNHSRAYAFPIQKPLEQLNEWGIPSLIDRAKEKARNEALFGVNETGLIGICLPKVAEAARVYTH